MRALGTIPTTQGPPTPPRARPPLRRRSSGAGCRRLAGPLGALPRPGGMRTNSRAGALAARAIAAGPLIEITPTAAEYEELCRDLGKLRKLGAPSNTAAVLAAVHTAAAGKKTQGKSKTPGGGGTPGG